MYQLVSPCCSGGRRFIFGWTSAASRTLQCKKSFRILWHNWNRQRMLSNPHSHRQGDQELTGWCVNLLEEYIIFLWWSCRACALDLFHQAISCNNIYIYNMMHPSVGTYKCTVAIVQNFYVWRRFLWRLWCVYEWVCFLLCHDPMDIEICADPFVRESTLPLFIEAIGNFKLDSCQCFREASWAASSSVGSCLLFPLAASLWQITSISWIKYFSIVYLCRSLQSRAALPLWQADRPILYNKVDAWLWTARGFSASMNPLRSQVARIPESNQGTILQIYRSLEQPVGLWGNNREHMEYHWVIIEKARR